MHINLTQTDRWRHMAFADRQARSRGRSLSRTTTYSAAFRPTISSSRWHVSTVGAAHGHDALKQPLPATTLTADPCPRTLGCASLPMTATTRPSNLHDPIRSAHHSGALLDRTLTAHGYPLRIYIPDRYGMKQPKWINIKVMDHDEDGYWVERGWDKVRMKATSVIDPWRPTASPERGALRSHWRHRPRGGARHLESRGQDGWRTMEVAKLRQPLSRATWVIWRYDWPCRKGDMSSPCAATTAGSLRRQTQPGVPLPARPSNKTSTSCEARAAIEGGTRNR